MILVLGSTGFLGKRVCRKLDYNNMEYVGTSLSLGVDLRNKDEASKLFEDVRPDYVINCAAFVGGIQFGYKHPAEIFKNNMEMFMNILDCCNKFSVKRLVNPISNCAYPADATFFKEDEFWNGPLHESVLSYGFVRKASWVASWAYNRQYNLDVVNLILSNMYGPEDHFDEERSHALGALIKKIVDAKNNNHSDVIIWGCGKPVREWLYVDDGAEAIIRGLSIESHIEPINIGVGKGISIIDMANLIKDIVGYKGELVLDLTKPDGAKYKTVDGSLGKKIFNWTPEMDFKQGVINTIEWYINHRKK